MAIIDRSFSTLFQMPVNLFLEKLTVDTGVMRQKADEVNGRIQEMKTAFSQMEEMAGRTQHYWMGEAGDAHRAYFSRMKPEVDEIFLRLSEHVTELREMASIYEKAEREASEISADLPSDAIT